MADPVLPPVRAPFRALAAALTPEAAALDEQGWEAAEAIIERALSDRPESIRRQLRLFIRVAGQLLPALRYGRTFRRLDESRRHDFLTTLERSRLLLLRRGLWGLRTLVFMGVYGQDDVRRRIGFGGDPRGWAAHR